MAWRPHVIPLTHVITADCVSGPQSATPVNGLTAISDDNIYLITFDQGALRVIEQYRYQVFRINVTDVKACSDIDTLCDRNEYRRRPDDIINDNVLDREVKQT